MEDGTSEVDRVLVGLRLHHVHYGFSLSGAQLEDPKDGVSTYYGDTTPLGRRMRTIAWSFKNAELL